MKTSNSWVIEYSQSKDAFHLGKSTEMVRRNLMAMQSDYNSDYVCIGIYSSKGRALDAMLELRRKRASSNTISFI